MSETTDGKVKYFKHPPELRERALAMVDERALTHAEIATKLHVSQGWLNKLISKRNAEARARGGLSQPTRVGRPPSNPELNEITRLRQRVFELEHEVSVLEKTIVRQVLTIDRLKREGQ